MGTGEELEQNKITKNIMKEVRNKIQESIDTLDSSNEYKVLGRVPEALTKKESKGRVFKAALILVTSKRSKYRNGRQ